MYRVVEYRAAVTTASRMPPADDLARFPTTGGVKTGRRLRRWIYVIRSNELRNC